MPGSAMIPCLRYADAPAAIAFLCEAFGFEPHAVYADDADPAIATTPNLCWVTGW